MEAPDIYLRECLGCHKRKPVRYMMTIRGAYPYCQQCGRDIMAIDETVMAPLLRRVVAAHENAVDNRPRGMVKRWDEQEREWRWVSKSDKPKLRPYGN
jgi:hypothetical protein